MRPALSTIKKQQGFSVAEVIIAAAVLAIFMSGLVSAYIGFGRQIRTSGNKQKAVMLAEEALEAVRNIRDNSFANLSDGTYGLSTAGNQWNFSGSSDTTGSFTRQTTVSTITANQKQITSTVSWRDNSNNRSVSETTYMTNWQAGSIGDWSTTTLASSLDLSGANDGLKIQVSGNYAYVIRNDGTSDFQIIDISAPASPSLKGSLTITGTPQNIFVSGNYAYVVSNDNSQELQIIDISNPSSPSVAGTFNATGNADALGVFVSGATAYLVRASSADNEFIIVNVATPSAPTLVGSLDLAATGYEVVASGNYAYVASGSNSQELQVVSIIVPAVPVLVGSLNLSGNTDATTLGVAGSTIFLGQGSTLYTVDVSNPLLPSTLGSIGVSGTLNDIALNLGNSNKYVFIATSDSANEFKVINVTALASPVVLGQRNIAGTNPLFGAAYDSSLDRAFIVGQSDTEELDIIAPQ